MPCLCNVDIKVKPNEYCSYCVNKHLTTALAMVEDCRSLSSIEYLRAAAQVYLAMMHLSEAEKTKENQNIINGCLMIIDKMLDRKEEVVVLLKNLTASFWKYVNSHIVSTFEKYEDMSLNSSSFKMAVLKVAAAIELVKYELKYEKVNFTFAIGQLVMAAWILQKYDKQLALRCKSFYNQIENKELDVPILEAFRNSLWEKLDQLPGDMK